jgi:hypothetical protein
MKVTYYIGTSRDNYHTGSEEFPRTHSLCDKTEAASPPLDLCRPGEPWTRRRLQGKALRSRTPRESHAVWKPANDGPNPLDLITTSNAGRQKDFVPLRMGRMAESPFAFLRGADIVMASDFAHTPVNGIDVGSMGMPI